jgi:hypothetical protein
MTVKMSWLLVRYEKKVINFLGLLQLACAPIWMGRRAQLTVIEILSKSASLARS